ncbi:MAG: hypothetical protein B7Z51_08985, partial [Methyloversatilis sp. 12-65-5]
LGLLDGGANLGVECGIEQAAVVEIDNLASIAEARLDATLRRAVALLDLLSIALAGLLIGRGGRADSRGDQSPQGPR